MGEIAEMMLDGMMCQWCGECIDDPMGFPTVCAGCQQGEGVDQHGDRDRRGHEDDAVDPVLAEEVREDDSECTQRHERPQAAARLGDEEQGRWQVDDVALAQHGHAE